jgi:hypothetical protein
MIGVLPKDVAAAKKGRRIATDVAAQGLQYRAMPAGLTEPELKAIAAMLRALIDQGL